MTSMITSVSQQTSKHSVHLRVDGYKVMDCFCWIKLASKVVPLTLMAGICILALLCSFVVSLVTITTTLKNIASNMLSMMVTMT